MGVLESEIFDVEEELKAIDAMAPVSLQEGWRISEEIQQEAVANGTAGMTMEEIDEEIAACRREWQVRHSRVAAENMAECSSRSLVQVAQ